MATAVKGSRKRSGTGNIVTIGAVVVAVVLVGSAVGILLTSSGGSTRTAVGGFGGQEAASAGTTALQPTGEVSSMGVPVVETPGYASGTARAGGVTVQGANWAMGQVPLDVAVRPFWTLTNAGSTKITLGDPKVDIRRGCCPGPTVFGARTLAPGASTVLTFELAMHEGMDGPHDMGVYVPIHSASGDEWLELNVTGDFRN